MTPRSYHVVLDADGVMVGGECYDADDADLQADEFDEGRSANIPHRPAVLVEKGSEVGLTEGQKDTLYREWRYAERYLKNQTRLEPRGFYSGVQKMISLLGLLPEFRERLEKEKA